MRGSAVGQEEGTEKLVIEEGLRTLTRAVVTSDLKKVFGHRRGRFQVFPSLFGRPKLPPPICPVSDTESIHNQPVPGGRKT